MSQVVAVLLSLTIVAVASAAPVNEAAKPARVKRVANSGDVERYHVVVSMREGAEQAFLFLKVKKPSASFILFAGGSGEIIFDDGVIHRDTNFLVRSRFRFAEEGFNVAVVDSPSDYRNLRGARSTYFHALDIKGVIAYLREVSPAPVWLIGTSRGTISAANAASQLKVGGADGLVLTATVFEPSGGGGTLTDVDLRRITIPTLFVHHKDDRCFVTPYGAVTPHMRLMENAPKVEQIAFEGGQSGGGRHCDAEGPHGFLGIEDEVVHSISNWIKANNPR
ncbi:MAG: alpha/beta hydrolase [Deltaproteobacteria bacterium]|nr:alpha/beta hydrolase [Deltaproteobacteria bacterium]